MTSKFKCHDSESIPLIAWDSFWKNWKPNEDLNIEGLGGKEEEGLPAIFKMISFSIKEDIGTQFFPGSTGCISHRPWNPPPTMGGPLHFIST